MANAKQNCAWRLEHIMTLSQLTNDICGMYYPDVGCMPPKVIV
jgi:hypothetical protein